MLVCVKQNLATATGIDSKHLLIVSTLWVIGTSAKPPDFF